MELVHQSEILSRLNNFLEKTKITENDLKHLAASLNIWLMQELSSTTWELACNALVCLLYHSMHLMVDDKSNIISVCKIFQQRWFNFDENQFPVAISIQQKLSCYGSLIILFHHHFPNDSALQLSKDILEMPNGLMPIPKNIANGLFINQHKELNVILLHSLHCLLKLPISVVHMEDGYCQSLLHFFMACQAYRGGCFSESINILSKIDITMCSSILGGWVYALTGVNFYNLKKYQVALRNFHTSLNHAPGCIIALYFSAKCFKTLKNSPAETECLQLFIAACEEEISFDESLHGILINYHQPSQYVFSKVKLLLALTQLKHGNLKDTENMLIMMSSSEIDVKAKTIPAILNENDLPTGNLSSHAVQFLQLLTSIKEGKEMTTDFSRLPALESLCKTLSSNDNCNIEDLSIFASYALKVFCLRLTNVEEALRLATRLELLCGRGKDTEGPVTACFYAIVRFIYTVLINIHKEKGQAMNAYYYNKLLGNFKQIHFDIESCSYNEFSKIHLEIVFNHFEKLI